MTILSISGSQRKNSTNHQLLAALANDFPTIEFQYYPLHLPLFHADLDHAPFPKEVIAFRQALSKVDAVIICTPAYLHNLPASLKNALEWVATSGELRAKPVLALTFTPHPPRGEKAMQSLLWSLQALEARVVGQLPLYQTEISLVNQTIETTAEIKELLTEAIKLITK